jgi:GntR family transcriptional repressor for pyruvate dehydrogenase complex
VGWLWQLRNESEISTPSHERVHNEGSPASIEYHRRILNALQERNADAAKRATRQRAYLKPDVRGPRISAAKPWS